MRHVPLGKIRIDGGTQPRTEINQLVIDDYAEAMRAGREFPPVTLFLDGVDHWLADGFHRYHAARAAGRLELSAKVEKGTQRDAVLFACGANSGHGLRRSNEDKRRAVGILLADKEWGRRSDRWIADKCGVSPGFVDNLRKQLPTVGTCGGSPRSGQDGKVYPAKPRPSLLSPETRERLRAIARGELETEPEPAFAPGAVREVLRGLPQADDRSEVRAIERLATAQQAAVVERLADGAGSVREALRQSQRDSLPTPTLPKGPKRYRVIYADPPWQYNDSRALDGYSSSWSCECRDCQSGDFALCRNGRQLYWPRARMGCWNVFTPPEISALRSEFGIRSRPDCLKQRQPGDNLTDLRDVLRASRPESFP